MKIGDWRNQNGSFECQNAEDLIGTRPNGETGLFPEAYVEEVQEEGPPAMAPPPLPQVLLCKLTVAHYHLVLAGLQQPTACSSPQHFRHIQSCGRLEQVQCRWNFEFVVAQSKPSAIPGLEWQEGWRLLNSKPTTGVLVLT